MSSYVPKQPTRYVIVRGTQIPRVFISHKNTDSESKTFFDKYFSSSAGPYKAYWYGWEGPSPPHATKLRDEISNSKSVFVILSKECTSTHTAAWIGYEVGIAAKLGIPVWVFEKVNEPVNLPIPYCNHYIKFDPSFTGKDALIQSIINSGGHLTGESLHAVCSYPDCQAQYNMWQNFQEWNCPVCKKSQKWGPSKELEKFPPVSTPSSFTGWGTKIKIGTMDDW